MTPPSRQIIEMANQAQQALAGANLAPAFARLYSQHTRLRAGRQPLRTWTVEESLLRLDDATGLLEAAFLQQETNPEGAQASMRRAAELLEWLSHPETNTDGLPLQLLSAAIYQLAGYPARASALLSDDSADRGESRFLQTFLQGDFPTLLDRLGDYWGSRPPEQKGTEVTNAVAHNGKFQRLIVDDAASSLGVLCAAFRWGEESRLDLAIKKLEAISGVLLENRDSYSWLLAKLISAVARRYVLTSMRTLLRGFDENMTESGKRALERYVRLAFITRKAVAWPSQSAGIARLRGGSSFVLCTPTGSGKTTVAELAILQRLFGRNESEKVTVAEMLGEPIALYLVPSRALAAEVESRLSRVLRRLSAERVVVTGLYGGTDWGPTDAWLTSSEKTVLICTYEKAEALLRFLGPLFIGRVNLVIVDEAHAVQLDDSAEAIASLRNSENRALRLESLGMRLFSHVEQNSCRIIALSAVAAGLDEALAGWVAGSDGDALVRSSYRSTRQLVGRLECRANGGFEIHYDLLDGTDVLLSGRAAGETPYIPNPFPPHPGRGRWVTEGVEVRLRPYLLWAAIHLAAPNADGRRQSVLISIPQRIQDYAADFLKLLTLTWADLELPSFFHYPADLEKRRAWERCLRASADYFGDSSLEYQLLQRGIALHYGRMPGQLGRHQRIVQVVVATSTLSEGINLPFETILLASLRRHSGDLTVREFRNLVGRAGRPGVATEGRALVLLSEGDGSWSFAEARRRYYRLTSAYRQEGQAAAGQGQAVSPLASLIHELVTQWMRIMPNGSSEGFLNWLEVAAPSSTAEEGTDEETEGPMQALDALDGVLLAALVETEQFASQALSEVATEERLKQIWRRSYAHYSESEEAILEKIFLRRGLALRERLLPSEGERRRLYKTCLPPRSARQLIALYPQIKLDLDQGREYARQTAEEKLDFIVGVIERVGQMDRFRCRNLTIRNKSIPWQVVLRWWLAPMISPAAPTGKHISVWLKLASDNFGYRFAWGLGSILSLATDEIHGGELLPTSLDEWPKTGLPWIAFWLKELMIWGTLDPVAAYLLARGQAETRIAAEQVAITYYQEKSSEEDANEVLNPARIREWVESKMSPIAESKKRRPPELEVRFFRL